MNRLFHRQANAVLPVAFGLVALVQLSVAAADAPAKNEAGEIVYHLQSRGVRVHDPSTIVKCKDEYWFFNTGRGVVSYRSKDLVNWQPGPPVFTNRPAWTLQAVPNNRGGDQGDYWAPDVIYHGNRYLLYYSVSTFGSRVSAIGLATNPTLDPSDLNYRWTDQGLVFQTSSTNSFNAIDPSVTLEPNGNLWLAFGSFWGGIKLIQLDPATGKRIAPDSPLHSLAANQGTRDNPIEAVYIHRNAGLYYLFVNWDRCCRGTNSTYNIRIGRSENITGPYLDKTGKEMMQNGGTLFLETAGQFIGPGHAGIYTEAGTNWFSCHFYDGNRRGQSTLGMGQLKWGADGWPFLLPVSNPERTLP